MYMINGYEPPRPKEPKWKKIISIIVFIILVLAFSWFKSVGKREIRQRNRDKAGQEFQEAILEHYKNK